MIESPTGPDLLSPSALFASGLAGTDRLVVLSNDQSVTARAILDLARKFGQALTRLGPSRVAVCTSRVECLLAAIGGSVNTGCELILLPAFASPDHPLARDARAGAMFDDRLELRASMEGHRPSRPGLILPTRDGRRLVLHDMDAFLARIPNRRTPGCWLLTDPAASFSGLQMALSAFCGGGILLSYPEMPVPQLAQRAVAHQASHISGTPVFFRSFLRALKEQPGKAVFKQITLCEEIAPAALLEQLRTSFPKARLIQAHGSPETGSLFSVNDGLPGFPAEWLDQGVEGCQLRIQEGRLEIISQGVMREYISPSSPLPRSADGWFKTGYAAVREGNRVLLDTL